MVKGSASASALAGPFPFATATDIPDALEGALASVATRANQTLTLERQCEPLLFDGMYYTSRSLNLKQTMRLLGTGTKYSTRTRIRFPTNSDGIVVNMQTTTGSTNLATPTTTAQGTFIDGIHLLGGGGSTGHGLRMRARASFINGGVRNFAQDGVNIYTWAGDVTTPNLGNANCFNLNDLWLFANGRHGVFVAGSEGNAGYGIGLDSAYNGCWGIFDCSFLGSFWYNCHTDQNGNRNYVTNAGVPAGTEAFNSTETGEARVNHAGRAYMVRLGQEALASTTEPLSGMLTPWFDQGAGSVAAPAWVSGMQVRSGGPYAAAFASNLEEITAPNANNRAAFKGVYAESGQAPCQVDNKGSIEGFIDEVTNVGSANWIRQGLGDRLTLTKGFETDTGDHVANGGAYLAKGSRDFGGFVGGTGFYRNNGSGLTFVGGAGTNQEMLFATAGGATVALVPTGSTNLHLFTGLVLNPTAAPASPTNGQIWYDTALGKFRKREAGVTSDLAGSSGGLSDGDKGDVVVASSGANLTVESASPASGSFDVAGRVKITANGAFGSSQIYKDAAGGINIVGVAGSQSDLTFYTPGGATVFQNPTGTVDSKFYGHVNLEAGKVFRVNGTQVVGARQTGTAANATDLATAIALVNDLKAKLAVHGLVA